MQTGAPALEFEGVSVEYSGEERLAIEGVSFTIERGERVALIGPNGSGKTTILLATVALIPFTGRIRVGGVEVDQRRPEPTRGQVGFLFSRPEDQILFPRVLDDVAFTLTSRGVPEAEAYERARTILSKLGAEDLAERSPARLSTGQRLRVALAGVLIAEPPLILLDEPTSGLDPEGRERLIDELSSLPRGSTLLIATHDLDFVSAIADRALTPEGRSLPLSADDRIFCP